MSFVIAIDGPAASGKSSAARVLSQKLGAVLVNSGAMYRGITWAALEAGVDLADPDAVTKWAGDLVISCGQRDGQSTMLIGGVDPEPFIREQRVNEAVSAVSAVPAVRTLLVEKFRSYQGVGNVIMEGRDIGSVVFPNTPYKFYVDANEEVRNARRKAQGEVDSIAKRDQQDSTRKTAPLMIPEGATVVDSSHLSLEEVVETLLQHLRRLGLENV